MFINHLQKPSMEFHFNWRLIALLTLIYTSLNEGNLCKDCTSIVLDTESKNIMYGASVEYKCNCQWRIPASMDTDDNNAVVLLLRNVSLPMTSGISSGTDCSGKLRFPGNDGYSCSFTNNYCLAFATESTICNGDKISQKIRVSNHTCTSITSWSKVGGSPYKILYSAGNWAGFTKYFTIQYLVIDCKDSITTTSSETTNEQQITKDGNMKFNTTTTLNNTTTDGNIANSIKTTECPREDCFSSSITAGMLGTAVGLVVGIMVGVLSSLLVQRSKNLKPTGKRDSTELEVVDQNLAVRKRSTDENNITVSDENEYEVPIRKDKNNERQYVSMKSGDENQYQIMKYGKKETQYGI